MKITVRLVDRPKLSDWTYYEIIIDGKGTIQGISEQDLRLSRCSEQDFIENTALDLAETRGYVRETCKVTFEGVI